MDSDQNSTLRRKVPCPRGFYPARVDAGGRLKLPARCAEYALQFEDRILFVTKQVGFARIYLNGAWERELAKLDGDPELRAEVWFEADRDGADVDLDPQGRVTLPQKLRDELKLENKAVQVRITDDIITIYLQSQIDERSTPVAPGQPTALERAKKFGFDVA